MIGGNASSTSMHRMSAESAIERVKPANNPMEMPKTYARAVAAPARAITDRPPHSTRLSTSRPRKSVPSGKALAR